VCPRSSAGHHSGQALRRASPSARQGKERSLRYTRIFVTHYGGPDALRVVEEECPEPKQGEVRVKVLAAGVSLPDIMAREGVHPETPPVPYTPGWDLVGEVDRLGNGVSGIKPDQVVAASPYTARTRSSSACRSASWFRCHPGWMPPRPSASF
jgi:D-arabinose 1-dehydrogenase-like Zn-dependent alcohol dehydrogenase